MVSFNKSCARLLVCESAPSWITIQSFQRYMLFKEMEVFIITFSDDLKWFFIDK